MEDELIRIIVRHIKKTSAARDPEYDLPADSFLTDAVKSALKEWRERCTCCAMESFWHVFNCACHTELYKRAVNTPKDYSKSVKISAP